MERKLEENPYLVRKAEQALESDDIKNGVNHLLEELAKGNMNPGTASRPLGNGIFEHWHDKRARVIVKEAAGDVVLILGIRNKNKKLQDDVIREVLRFFIK